MLGAATIFALKDGFAKHLSTIYPVAELLWAQYSLLLVLVPPYLIWRFGWKGLRPFSFISQIFRGMLGVGTVGLFYLAIQDIPLADATALSFITPIIVTLLSPWLLNEKVGLRRWLAVIVGFIGILLVVQPGFQEIRIGTAYGLAAGVGFAFFQIATRKLAQRDAPMLTVLYTALVGGGLLNALLPVYWISPQSTDWAMLLVMSAFAATGQAMLIYAFVSAPAAVVSPFFYVTIIVATATGYVAFGDFPNLIAWSGIAIVIACGIFIALREAKVKEAVDQ